MLLLLFIIGLILIAIIDYVILLDPRIDPPLFFSKAAIPSLWIKRILFIDKINQKREKKIVVDYYRTIPILLFIGLSLILLLLAFVDFVFDGYISQFIDERLLKILFVSLAISDLVYEAIIRIIWYLLRKKQVVNTKQTAFVKSFINSGATDIDALDIIAIFLTLICFMTTFSFSFVYGDFDVFGILGVFSFLWLCAFSIPFCIILLILGIQRKRKFHIYFSSIILCLSIGLSCCSLYRSQIDYTNAIATSIEQESGVDLPDSLQVMSISKSDYRIGYAKILDDDEKLIFEEDISTNSSHWISSLPTEITSILPKKITDEIDSFDMLIFYDYTTNIDFNVLATTNGDYLSILVAYDSSKSKLVLVDELQYSIV